MALTLPKMSTNTISQAASQAAANRTVSQTNPVTGAVTTTTYGGTPATPAASGQKAMATATTTPRTGTVMGQDGNAYLAGSPEYYAYINSPEAAQQAAARAGTTNTNTYGGTPGVTAPIIPNTRPNLNPTAPATPAPATTPKTTMPGDTANTDYSLLMQQYAAQGNWEAAAAAEQARNKKILDYGLDYATTNQYSQWLTGTASDATKAQLSGDIASQLSGGLEALEQQRQAAYNSPVIGATINSYNGQNYGYNPYYEYLSKDIAPIPGYTAADFQGVPIGTVQSSYGAYTPVGNHYDETLIAARDAGDMNAAAAVEEIAQLQAQYGQWEQQRAIARAVGDEAEVARLTSIMNELNREAENLRAPYGYQGGYDGTLGPAPTIEPEEYYAPSGYNEIVTSTPYEQELSYIPPESGFVAYDKPTSQYNPDDYYLPPAATPTTEPDVLPEEPPPGASDADRYKYYDALLRYMTSGRASAADAPILGVTAGTAYGNNDYAWEDYNGDGTIAWNDLTTSNAPDNWSDFYANPYGWTDPTERDELISEYYSDYLLNKLDGEPRSLTSTDYTPEQMANYQQIVMSLLENDDPLTVIRNAENSLGKNIYRQLLGENLYSKMLSELQRLFGDRYDFTVPAAA